MCSKTYPFFFSGPYMNKLWFKTLQQKQKYSRSPAYYIRILHATNAI